LDANLGLEEGQEETCANSRSEYQFEEYYDYIHPRRSSKEVLDFTSSRKSQKDLTKLEEDREGGGSNSSRVLGSRYPGEDSKQKDRDRHKESDHRWADRT
jgi:hypothetical protein